ncbi:hypothetical protein GB937_008683 [Aspergillus fischeri]|nr:hypothetical protein GB937_008683 [Aspergillus fischeri]
MPPPKCLEANTETLLYTFALLRNKSNVEFNSRMGLGKRGGEEASAEPQRTRRISETLVVIGRL